MIETFFERLSDLVSKYKVSIEPLNLRLIVEYEKLDFLNRIRIKDYSNEDLNLHENVFRTFNYIFNKIPAYLHSTQCNFKALDLLLSCIKKEKNDPYLMTLPQIRIIYMNDSEYSNSFEFLQSVKKKNLLNDREINILIIGRDEIERFVGFCDLRCLFESINEIKGSLTVLFVSNSRIEHFRASGFVVLNEDQESQEYY